MPGESSVAGPQLNATPLIDVMLVLLVILIITLPVATHAVKLNLPHGRDTTPPPTVRVDLVADGAIYWNGEELASIDQLQVKFAAVARNSAAPRIQIVPEKRTRYERVAQVLVLAQRSRVTSLGLAPVDDRNF
jgi:biopolymer transport protein ExbD